MTEVAVFVKDFELGARIADVAAACGKKTIFPESGASIERDLTEKTELIILDLNEQHYRPLELIRRIRINYPKLPVVGFLPRVQKVRYLRAREVGCTWVLPKSSLVKNLPTLLEKSRLDDA